MSELPADGFDPVPRWIRAVRTALRAAPPGKRGIRGRVTSGFVFLMLIGTCAGPRPAPQFGLVILLTLLMQELPWALWARAQGRRVNVTIDFSGARTDIAGASMPTLHRLVGTLLGSAAILLLGGGLLALGRRLDWSPLVEIGRLQLLWGSAQVLPLTPFKVGVLLREQVGHVARVKQAVASLGLAVAVLVKTASYLGLPLVLVAFLAWFSACVRQLWSSVLEARDLRLAAGERLAQISALTLGDEPQRALQLARELWRAASSKELRDRAALAVAWAAIGSGNAKLARDVISELPERNLDAHLVASYLAISGRPREAVELLELAATLGARSAESFKLLADLYLRLGEHGALSRLLRSAAGVLSDADLERIERALATTPAPRSESTPDVVPVVQLHHALGK